ncbi:hypothetical protein T35B1_05668 [Salinisphaera shabanensis T35B1]
MTKQSDQNVLKLRDAIVDVVKLAISRLYGLPIEELRVADPSLEEIIRLCSLFNKVVEGTDIDGEFTEAISVLAEASLAAKEGDEQQLVDCAYHLEDFIQSRLS